MNTYFIRLFIGIDKLVIFMFRAHFPLMSLFLLSSLTTLVSGAHLSNKSSALVQVELAKKLVGTSFADRIFYANSGTEANEAAIKFARKYHRHTCTGGNEPATEFIAFTNGFHGRTLGALALTSKEQYRTPFQPVMPGVTFVEYGNAQAATDLIHQGKIAAVFVEPVQGEGGIHSATKEFLEALRKACDETGTLLVYDEVYIFKA